MGLSRVCGGTRRRGSIKVDWRGLSPRVRGNRPGRPGDDIEEGSIPACAGEPTMAADGEAPPAVYPRVCGEPSPAVPSRRPPSVYPRVCGGTDFQPSKGHMGIGLSPRVRGNPCLPVVEPIYTGSIPACAGNPAGQLGIETSNRSIPACAGEPNSRTSLCTKHTVYPRVCGEPTSSRRSVDSKSVYPRVCGGTVKVSPPSTSTAGLSPRVRGNLRWHGAVRDIRGSIPACAGEPVPKRRAVLRRTVYPRVCGEPSAGCAARS